MRHPKSKLATAAILSLGLISTGCMLPQRDTLTQDQRSSFRAEALEFLQRQAYSDEPVLRMQAIEALQDVAPREGRACIAGNIDNGYAGVSFAALMAGGTIADAAFLPQIRTRAEDSDASVRVAALYALHRMGYRNRTGELGDYLLNNRDARVRANAALAIGRLRDRNAIALLTTALRREKKDAVKMQIEEALAMLGESSGIERLMFYGYSAVPDQAALGVMMLANARTAEAEDLFRLRLGFADQPEIKLQAARGLGYLGYDVGMDLALAHLRFRSPDRSRLNDPPEQQVQRIRALAALALEAIGSPEALGELERAFHEPGQSDFVKLAVARAAVSLIDRENKAIRAVEQRPGRLSAGASR